MTSPTVSTEIPESEKRWEVKSKQGPLLIRRCGAWATELSLVVLSSLVPAGLGWAANRVAEPVPLNPMVGATTEAIASTLAIPIHNRSERVTPLTNLFWSGAVIAPFFVVGWQLYLLAKTGQTTPKRWFEIKVVAAGVQAPGWRRAILRELVGKGTLPMGLAYLTWHLTGAYPSLAVLGGLAGAALLGDFLFVRFSRLRRTGHDALADTFVVDALSGEASVESAFTTGGIGEDAAIAAIVLSPQKQTKFNLWGWMREHPGLTLSIVTISGMAAVLGTFVGTQVYIQSQANFRQLKEQDNNLFLALVSKLSRTSGSPQERSIAISALGSMSDPRAVPFLVELIAQEKNPPVLDAIQQSLVTAGPIALPNLRQMNQALKNDRLSMSFGGSQQEKELVALRLQATQKAIAKILKVRSSELDNPDLSHTDLGQNTTGSASFTLILENTDLSGIRLRSAILHHANFKNSRFYGPGKDGRLGTFDDLISDLSGSDFSEVNLNGAYLGPATIRRSNFFKANLNKARMANAVAAGSNFSSAQLLGADMQQADLKEASFTGAELGTANLSGANLQKARMSRVNAEGANFEGANLIQSNWQGANLSGANFAGANLQNSDLSLAELTDASLRNAQLQNANLRNADLTFADLRGANLNGTDFKGAKLTASTPSQVNQFLQVPPNVAQDDRLKGVDFNFVKNLDVYQINYICAQGGIYDKCPQ
ncbi:MAG: pentapeptide repeat-containing protein [Cyanobacteriota bacterium]|nr:pentapeptide repeat-containing protein [Cyanobacteriota bacterium]